MHDDMIDVARTYARENRVYAGVAVNDDGDATFVAGAVLPPDGYELVAMFHPAPLASWRAGWGPLEYDEYDE